MLVLAAFVLTAVLPTVAAQPLESSEGAPEEAIAAALGYQSLPESGMGIDWYASNGEFMRLRRLEVSPDVADIPGDGWVVAVDVVGGEKSRREEYGMLFRDGTAVGGEYTRYTADGSVIYRRRVDASGSETLSERMTYRGDGTVRSVRRCDEEGCLTARFAPPGAGGEESIIGESLTLQIRFNTTARPEYVRIDRDGAVTEEFLSYEEGELTERRIVRGESVVTTTYAEGRVLLEEERLHGRLVRRTENTYDEQERVVRRVEIRRNLRRDTQWNYHDGDDYVMERFENEMLVLREEATDDTTVRTHFRNGDPVFRETETAGEATRREIFVDGAFEEENLR